MELERRGFQADLDSKVAVSKVELLLVHRPEKFLSAVFSALFTSITGVLETLVHTLPS